MLTVGDTVNWSNGWGMDFPKKAKVTSIEETDEVREKYGKDVQQIPWSRKDYCTVDLDNGHWAYGEQIEPLQEDEMEHDEAGRTYSI